jgi:hypothetical protein
MHGMGPNRGDLPSMCLLGELLYRHSFGKPYMREVTGGHTGESGFLYMSGKKIHSKWPDAQVSFDVVPLPPMDQLNGV